MDDDVVDDAVKEKGREIPQISEIRKTFTDWHSNQRRQVKRKSGIQKGQKKNGYAALADESTAQAADAEVETGNEEENGGDDVS